MSDAPTETLISCPCGKCKVKTTTAPLGAGICHCVDCRKLSQGVAFEGIIFPPSSFSVESGNLTSTKRPDMNMTVKACEECKTMVFHTDKSDFSTLSGPEYRRNYNIDTLPEGFAPTFHCYYKDRVVDVSDDLVKFADVPESFGGTGKMLNMDGSPVGV